MVQLVRSILRPALHVAPFGTSVSDARGTQRSEPWRSGRCLSSAHGDSSGAEQVSDEGGISGRATAWMTLSYPQLAKIDLSHLSDEEFDALARQAVGDGLAERLERAAGKTYQIAKVVECSHDQTDIYGTHDIACDAFLPDGECSCGKVRRRCCECGMAIDNMTAPQDQRSSMSET